MKKILLPACLFALLSGTTRAEGLFTETKVKGMVCSFCAQGVEKAFRKRPEVESVRVDLDKKTVYLKFKEGKTLSDEEIKKLIGDAGYDVQEIGRKEKAGS